MIEILLASFICLSIFIFCKFFNKFIFKNSYKTLSYTENSIFGVIWISFIVLIINFFLPINIFVGNLFLISSIILFLIFFIFEQNKKKLFFFLIITSIITFFYWLYQILIGQMLDSTIFLTLVCLMKIK